MPQAQPSLASNDQNPERTKDMIVTSTLDSALMLCEVRGGEANTLSPVVYWCNTAAAQKLGTTPAELVGSEIFGFLGSGIDGYQQTRVTDTLRRGEAVTARLMARAKNGRDFPVWLRAIPLSEADSEGRGKCFLLALDVPTAVELDDDSEVAFTALENDADRAFKRTSKMFEKPEFMAATIRASGIGLWEWHIQSGGVQYSPEWFTMLGYEPAEYPPGFDTFEMLANPDDTPDIMRKAELAVEGPMDEYESQFRMKCKDGAWKWIKARGYVTHRDGAGKAVRILGTHYDLSEEMAREDALKEALEKANTATEVKSQFLATMSHEIRTPLTGIMGMLDHVLQTSLDPDQRKAIEVAVGSSRHLLSILNDTLDYSKLETGTLTIDKTEFSPAQIATEITSLFRAKADAKGLDLQLDKTGLSHDRVLGDSAKIRQILLNLVGNAIKFTETGRVAFRVSSTDGDGGQKRLCFCVKDSGIGIPESAHGTVFESFSQADASTSRKYGGTGLGLAISRRLARLLGGDITFTSQAGEGSEFRLVILVQAANQAEAGQAASQGPTATTTEEAPQSELSGHILLVEDNPINQTVVMRYLAQLGLTCDVASNGREGVEKSLERRFDTILMDAHMPVLDGLGATQAIRTSEGPNQHTHIIALTADAMAGAKERFLEAGMDDYVAKPIDLDQLRAALHAGLERSRKGQ